MMYTKFKHGMYNSFFISESKYCFEIDNSIYQVQEQS